MNEIVYQLVAKGRTLNFENTCEIRSSTVFRTKDAAERRISKFREKVTSSANLFSLADDENLKIAIVILNIVED